ncbi:E3 ubiquitin-protein ligase parkin-like [Lineus longissimus]|uniref:E3 ubiquitin-protein ligase parkin-like n=1 Tax=Lineus longissimus TaxID=88925 RepID=UPI00315DA34D
MLRLNVKFNASTTSLSVNEGEDIPAIKKKISEKISCLDDEEICIIFAGKELGEHASLQAYCVQENSVLHVVKRKSNSVLKNPSELSYGAAAMPAANSDLRIPAGHGKNQYFVFCKSSCKTIKGGRLRVRCASCKQGAFTLNREPSCWHDVLTPGAISGDCLLENCDGNKAEFYFKCSGHVSEDTEETALVLHLIKPNIMDVPCITCMDTVSPVLVFPCESGHSMCLDCFATYCITKLNERAFIHSEELGYTLLCPAGCDKSLIKEIHHFRILGADDYDRYQRFGTEECLLKMGGVLCPRPGCGQGLLHEEGQRRIECESEGLRGCGFVFCRHCLEAYHEGSCQSRIEAASSLMNEFRVDPEHAVRAQWEAASQHTIHDTTRPCPNTACKVRVEKSGGCMHMVCPRCKFDWCWLCQTEWNLDCQGEHWFG